MLILAFLAIGVIFLNFIPLLYSKGSIKLRGRQRQVKEREYAVQNAYIEILGILIQNSRWDPEQLKYSKYSLAFFVDIVLYTMHSKNFIVLKKCIEICYM